jgi:hypothetical protein
MKMALCLVEERQGLSDLFSGLDGWTFGEGASKLCRYAPKDNLVDISKEFIEFQRDVADCG